MTDTTLSDADRAPDVVDYPTPRDPRCPFAQPADVLATTGSDRMARARIWDGSTPWLVTKYADQHALLTDPRLSIDEKREGYPHMTRGRSVSAQHTPPLITNTDAPEHTRMRRTVNLPFTVKRIEAMRPRIQELVDGLLDEMLAGSGPVDLVQAFALPVPTIVITEMLGMDYGNREDFQHASHTLVSHDATDEEHAAAGAVLGGHVAAAMEAKMAQPADDVMSELAARVQAGEMTMRGALSMSTAILIAGHETSASMIALGTLALLENPDQLEYFRSIVDDPKAVAGAVEELLRYLSIVHTGVRRIANEDIEVGGDVIRKDEGVILDVAAANWDTAQYPEPGRLDLTRAARSHHAFGYGAHQCLGQTLARVELQEAFRALVRRVPTLRLAIPARDVDFAYEGVAYGLHSLPVTW
ncbi:cytochrome P450 [Promicromonospora sukumoe]|uniref:Cytochrome P450 n=1 Tax=Promicromonospora sukumoe TaxID=88382 RepID=A0A7W3PDL1_9MICO|nr:cytochrome P450 [Promicromonospora sukumoe]MBA8807851.1 cytochrome P450 [Promicromonospora sukumoe]